MTTDSNGPPALFAERHRVVQQLTELNASHIRSETRLAGIEFEIGQYRHDLDGESLSEEIDADIRRLREEYIEIERSRREIDEQRERLDEQLQRIDRRIASLD